jgi:hypothetical protein
MPTIISSLGISRELTYIQVESHMIDTVFGKYLKAASRAEPHLAAVALVSAEAVEVSCRDVATIRPATEPSSKSCVMRRLFIVGD